MTSPDSQQLEYDVIPLNELLTDEYPDLSRRLREQMETFECSRSPKLQKFARQDVFRYESHGHSRTYLLIAPVDSGDIDVVGFFTVGMVMLDLSQASNQTRKKLTGEFSMDHTGAYSIAELARSDRYPASALPGRTILQEAKDVIASAREYVGGRYLVVDARREVFEALYAPDGFREVSLARPPQGMEEIEFVTCCRVIRDL